jgi:hypothetical protein
MAKQGLLFKAAHLSKAEMKKLIAERLAGFAERQKARRSRVLKSRGGRAAAPRQIHISEVAENATTQYQQLSSRIPALRLLDIFAIHVEQVNRCTAAQK